MEQSKATPRWKNLASVTVEANGQSIKYSILKDTVLNAIHLRYEVGGRGYQTIEITKAFRHDEQEGMMEAIAMVGSAINTQFHSMRAISFEDAINALSLNAEQKRTQATGYQFGLALYGDDPRLNDFEIRNMAVKASLSYNIPTTYLDNFIFSVRAGYEDAKVMAIKKAATVPEYDDNAEYTHWRMQGDQFWTPINQSLSDIMTGSTLRFVTDNTSVPHECATCFRNLLGVKYINEKISGPRDGIGPMYHHYRCAAHNNYKVEFINNPDAMTRDKNAERLQREAQNYFH